MRNDSLTEMYYPMVFTPPERLSYGLKNREARLLREELKHIRTGSLFIDYYKDRTYFTEYRNGARRRITKNTDRVYALARRAYITKRIKYLQGFDNGEMKKLLEKFQGAGLEISRIVMTQAQYKWANAKYERKSQRRDALLYSSPKGVRFRSKSEFLIGSTAEKYHLPYRTEPHLYLDGRWYHPDFVFMLPDNRLVILEHFGRTDLDEYMMDLIERLRIYENNGLILGVSVFVTFEQHTVSEDKVLSLLRRIISSDVPEICARYFIGR